MQIGAQVVVSFLSPRYPVTIDSRSHRLPPQKPPDLCPFSAVLRMMRGEESSYSERDGDLVVGFIFATQKKPPDCPFVEDRLKSSSSHGHFGFAVESRKLAYRSAVFLGVPR